jgi:hypothetical protein
VVGGTLTGGGGFLVGFFGSGFFLGGALGVLGFEAGWWAGVDPDSCVPSTSDRGAG